MENAGLDPASSCSEHSCLRQGPGVPWYSEDLKACGVCGGHLLRGHFCFGVLEVALVTWCHLGGVPVCVLAAGKAICPSVSFALGVCSVHFEL